MDIHSDGKTGVREAEVREAITDIAGIALQRAPFGTDSVSQSMALLLQRLVLLCDAQKGALFLAEEEDMGSHTSYVAHGGKRPRLIAVHEMSEEEADRQVLSFMPLVLSTAAVIVALNTPCWALCHIPIVAHSFSADRNNMHTGDLSSFPAEAWFLVGWSDRSACQQRGERARELLPQVAAPTGVALLSLLQAERIRELETAPYGESVREMELLKAELLATVSHELRSPLASIKGYTATLLRHERHIAAQERHEFLLAIQEASDRLHFIVDRFLQMSQLETASVKLAPVLIDVVRIAQEAIGVLKAQVEEHTPGKYSFRMHVNNASSEPATGVPLLMADPRLLREVLDNLLENAVSYSPEGGLIEIIIQVIPALASEQKWQLQHDPAESDIPATVVHGLEVLTPHTEQKGREMVQICVSDRGMGIENDYLERVFDRFYRVDTTLTRSVGGLGLGLAISKRIVELHHGTIHVERRPGGGSVFCIQLPITSDET